MKITESEKERILNMHKSASSRHYLMEQSETPESEPVIVRAKRPKPIEVEPITVTFNRSKNYYDVKLKKPTSDGFTTLTYNVSTGEIFGDFNNKNVVATAQSDLSKEELTDWLRKNKIK